MGFCMVPERLRLADAFTIMKKIEHYLEEKLAGGGFRIGQVQVIARGAKILVFNLEDTVFLPREGEDFYSNNLLVLRELGELRETVSRSASGNFRPLKYSPDLARGWVFIAEGTGGLRMALETIYPAAVGLWLARKEGELVPCSWREILVRQTGMFRGLAKISDGVAASFFGEVCEKGRCLRKVLWGMDAGANVAGAVAENLQEKEKDGEIPLVCFEACNFLLSTAAKRSAEGGEKK